MEKEGISTPTVSLVQCLLLCLYTPSNKLVIVTSPSLLPNGVRGHLPHVSKTKTPTEPRDSPDLVPVVQRSGFSRGGTVVPVVTPTTANPVTLHDRHTGTIQRRRTRTTRVVSDLLDYTHGWSGAGDTVCRVHAKTLESSGPLRLSRSSDGPNRPCSFRRTHSRRSSRIPDSPDSGDLHPQERRKRSPGR